MQGAASQRGLLGFGGGADGAEQGVGRGGRGDDSSTEDDDDGHHHTTPMTTLSSPLVGGVAEEDEDEDEERHRYMQAQGKWDWCFIQRLVASLVIIVACASLVAWLGYTVVTTSTTKP
jgi:hypothetical protein